MDIREVDLTDESALRAYWEVGKAAEDAVRAFDWWPPWESARVAYVVGRPGSDHVMLAAHLDGATVGTASIGMPTFDNLHLGFVGVYVHPTHQRRGIGSALLARCEGLMRDRNRRLSLGEAVTPLGVEGPSLAFAHARGYTDALEDGMKVVDLVETEPTWAALEEEAARRRNGYRLVAWQREVPEEHLAGFIHLNEAFNDEAPVGEMELQREVWSEQRVRDSEAQGRKVGRHMFAVAALAPNGEMVGLTEIVVNEHAPHRGMQSGTLVMPAHRGHGLGLGMKLANQRAVRRAYPGCRVLMTGNAGVNVAMNKVNEKLGYRDVERCVEVQKEL